MSTAEEKRLMVRNKYRTIIGRNIYSQEKRNYCYKKYSNGKYYSDCSSSICYTYKEVGLSFGILNTVGMWVSSKLIDVPVVIKKGIIQNPEVLRIGDMLLFAGTNSARKSYGYVGHVEMVGEINTTGVILYGHGSGNPKKHEMNAYCKSRYGRKTSNTTLGHTGLIRVRRFIKDDNLSAYEPEYSSVILSKGNKGSAVKELQENLIKLGFSCGACGADGDYGNDTFNAVMAFQDTYGLTQNGVFGTKEREAMTIALANYVEVTGASVNIRKGNTTSYGIIGVAKKGQKFKYLKQTSENGWHLVDYNNQKAWVSGIYSKLIE